MALQIKESTSCPSCGTPFQGPYCYQCGEKQVNQENLTLKHFFGKVWNAVTFTDIKFLRSLLYLLFKPGRLTSEYFHGRRTLFTAPLALFFAINLAYFIYQPVDALNSNLVSQIGGQPYSSWAKEQVKTKIIAEADLTEENISRKYNRISENVSKLFLFVLVLIFSVGVFLVNFKQSKYYYVHVITSTHFVSFTIISLLVIIPLLLHGGVILYLLLSGNETMRMDPNTLYLLIPAFFILWIYAFFMQRNLFQQKWGWNLIKSLLVVVAFLVSVLVYRLFLFVVTMALL